MTTFRTITCAQVLALAFVLLSLAPAAAEKRLALIIGNSAYTHSGELENPKNDARLIASALRRAGFEITVEVDADLKSMKRAFRSYAAKLKASGKDTVGFFYFAGHGTQVKGVNYLMPVDANIENESQVESEAVSASGLMAQLEGAANKMNLVILDSCRNNPFKRGYRAQVRGLAPMHAPPSTLVGYSTQPGNVAYDGGQGYSPYAIALHRAIRQTGQSVEAAFKQARTEVNEVTGGKQIPWEESSLFVDFYFFKDKPATPIKPAPWNGKLFNAEADYWKDV
ncbi:MAG: caspase family protein, partial [Hyphomicrobiaceae bacterium]